MHRLPLVFFGGFQTGWILLTKSIYWDKNHKYFLLNTIWPGNINELWSCKVSLTKNTQQEGNGGDLFGCGKSPDEETCFLRATQQLTVQIFDTVLWNQSENDYKNVYGICQDWILSVRARTVEIAYCSSRREHLWCALGRCALQMWHTWILLFPNRLEHAN